MSAASTMRSRVHAGVLGSSSLSVVLLLALAGAGCGSGGGEGNEVAGNGVLGAGSGGAGALPGNTGTPPPAVGNNTPPVGAAGATNVGASGSGARPPTTMMMMPTMTMMPAAGGGGMAGGDVMMNAGSGGMTAAGAGGMTMAGAGGSTTAGAGGSTPTTPDCLASDKVYDKDGPFKYDQKQSGAIVLYVPQVPSGCKVPVIQLSNGTGASCAVYAASLTRMASHGFLATCYDDPNTGSGQQGLMALSTAVEMYPDLADMRFGSTGHSQGGQAAFTALQLAEAKWGDKAVYAGLAMEPASGFGVQPSGGLWQQVYAKIKSPMFMFSGLGTDGLVSQGWVQQAFDALADSTEAYFWTAAGATHIPVPNGEEQEISIAWFRWKLLGDQDACKYFKSIPMKITKWVEVDSQNAQECK